jgi:hypothetical protein
MPDISTIIQLREQLGADRQQFLELWVTKPDGQALCALINSQTGWLMYLRENGDAGFSSRNPDFRGEEEATIEYVLGNGQHDSYPASWALPLTEVQRAVEHFITHSRPADWVVWHNDSGDEVVIGKAV